MRADQMTLPESLIRFVDDDDAYLRWSRAHAHWCVLNVPRTIGNAAEIVLHVADCPTVSKADVANYTTKDYIKICAPTSMPLQEWVASLGVGRFKQCGTCY